MRTRFRIFFMKGDQRMKYLNKPFQSKPSNMSGLRLFLKWMPLFLGLIMIAKTPRSVSAYMIISGHVGDNVQYSLNDEKGELILSGSGETYSYNSDGNGSYKMPKWLDPEDGNDTRKVIKTIVVGEGIVGIGDNLFRNCSEVTSISLPSTLKWIGKETFFCCSKLKIMNNLPAGLVEIRNSAFENCSGLTQVAIPKSVIRIGSGAFRNCDALNQVFFEKGSCLVTSGTEVFKVGHGDPWTNGRKIIWYTSDTIAASTISKIKKEWDAYVASDASYTCNWQWIAINDSSSTENTGGATVNPAQPRPFTGEVTIAGLRYKVKKGAAIVKKPVKKKAKKIDIPSSISINGKDYPVTEIAPNAFKGMKKLKTLTIGTNVQKIGKKAFYNCKKLKKITIYSEKLKAKKIGKNAFTGISKKVGIMCPKKKIKAYSKIFYGA